MPHHGAPQGLTPAAVDVEGRPTLRRLALPVICIAQLMAALDVTIVNLALPAMQDDLEVSHAALAWVIDAYTLAYAGLLLVGGRLGDLLGHRRTLTIGVAVFTTASLVAGCASSPAVLLTARVCQGFGAAMATPTGLSLVTTLCPPGPHRTRAMVAYGAMGGLGITLGLVLGGVLTEAASWRWVFLVNVPIGLFLLVMAPRELPETRRTAQRFDMVGAGTGTIALTALVYGVIRAGTDGWGDRASTTALVVSALLMAAFVAIELNVPEPTLPLRLLRDRTRLGAYLVAGLLFACLYPSFFLMSLCLQDVLQQGAIEAGLRFLPLGVGVIAFALAARALMASVGPRPLVLVGTAVTALSASGLVLMDASSPYVLLLLPCTAGLGAGVGTTFVATSTLAMTNVPQHEVGIASGLLSTFQAVGGTVGVAVLASVAASATRGELTRATAPIGPDAVRDALLVGIHHGLAIAGLLALAAVVVAALTTPRQ